MDNKQSLDPIRCLVAFKLLITHEQTIAAERHWPIKTVNYRNLNILKMYLLQNGCQKCVALEKKL